MDGSTASIASLQRPEFGEASNVLARAFFDTDQWAAVVPDEAIRRSKLQQMFEGTLKTAHVAGGVAERSDGFEAVALWLPPGRTFGFWPIVRSGFASARFVFTPPMLPLRPMTRMLRQFDEEHKRRMPNPHWYLMALGADPDHQGRGFGSALVDHGVRRADAEGAPVYLETESGPNVHFYESLGFEVVGTIVIDAYDLPMSILVRCPGAGWTLPGHEHRL